MSSIDVLCKMIRNRSNENRQVIKSIFPSLPVSPLVSVLRQELDSMVRAIYILSADISERESLAQDLLDGKRWTIQTKNGKYKELKDADLIARAEEMEGWTRSVYKFGCAFTHLSDYHNYYQVDPFTKLSAIEKDSILSHMRHYHGGPFTDNPSIEELAFFIPHIFEKIASNLEHYLKALESCSDVKC